MKALVVEDNFTSRKVLIHMLSDLMECDMAVNGDEAVLAFEDAFKNNEPYDVIFLDIMMPGKDGMAVLEEIRTYENQHGINGLDGVKIIITSGLDDSKSILDAFKSGCEGYIVKPYHKEEILVKMEELNLMSTQVD